MKATSGIWRPRCLPICCKRGNRRGTELEEQVRQQNEAVAENRPEAKNDENVSPQRQFWDKLKEIHPDALHLIRTGEVYRLYDGDAVKSAENTGYRTE